MKALAIALDSATCASLQRSLSGHGVDVERRSFDDAAEVLRQHRYAAVFLNCTDSQKSRDMLAAIEAIPHNRSAVVIGVAEGSASAGAAMRLGVLLVIQVPIATEMLARHIRAAYSLMVRRRPRNERVDVGSAITLRLGDHTISGRLANVSENGLGVEVPEPPPPVGTAVSFSFTIPDLAGEIEGSGAVVWANTEKACGIRIKQFSRAGGESFARWLDSRLRPTEVKAFFQHLAASVQKAR
jgi:PilZ domain